MEHMKDEVTPAKAEEIRKVVDYVSCDICKEKIVEGTYETREAELSMKVGDAYPELQFGDYTEYDVCTECFKSKIIPFMESLGAKPKVTEYHWES